MQLNVSVETLVGENMSACAVQSLAGAVPINLGLRVAVVGSDAFTNWVRGVVQMDSDVASVVTSTSLASVAAGRSLNLLIVDAGSVNAILPAEVEETLAAISLIGFSGLASESLTNLGNATAMDTMSPDWWVRLKQQTFQRRLLELSALMSALAEDSQSVAESEASLTLDDGGESNTVPVSSVDWIRAAGNYVEVRVNGRSHLLRSEMHNVQRRLTRSFLRIHRRVIINTQRLVSIENGNGARLFAVLATGDRFPISRARRQFVQSRWEEMRNH